MPRIYLAGPDVFVEHARELTRRKQQLCEAYGLDGLVPLDTEEPSAAIDVPSPRIFAANVALMRSADAIVANLTPYRGLSADVGTAFELGFMAALGKRLYGYSNIAIPFRERVAAVFGPVRAGADGRLFGADDLMVEDFGHADNLMIDEALAGFGHCLITAEVEPGQEFDDLTAFEACLVRVRRDLAGHEPS
ncbi:nucleoside 2-deoxyribosyltransferase [Chelatococcus reniformis]|uniref:Nucleoside 2-deoxyribosyltransferase n=1 Tax=Chelatococcus reniformis TaxID=1494448 RepID=A0A916XAA1_9HYPH|nr:nucleoside 2-deoxyribosyltransferase [Chelatococcus reniformis]GGC55712.1 nucleoside 2-deoxyribosyltransferase [Chelatococcus reniformis]